MYVSLPIYSAVLVNYSRVGQNRIYIDTVSDRMFGDFTANCTVCPPYIYGSGQL